MWRAAIKWKMKYLATNNAKWEVIPSKGEATSKARQAVVSVKECEDALGDRFLASQECVTFL